VWCFQAFDDRDRGAESADLFQFNQGKSMRFGAIGLNRIFRYKNLHFIHGFAVANHPPWPLSLAPTNNAGTTALKALKSVARVSAPAIG
jgi:hypothetical protein